jgi:hypothetical protein
MKLLLVVLAAVLVIALLGRLSILPPTGAINNRWLRAPPEVDDPVIGRSRGIPFAMRFRISPEATGFPGGIGRIAHDALFSGRPGLTFNVCYACGPQGYADPRSIWHDVFFGCFQVDVVQEEWGRPFAYDDGGSRVLREELARLVKADWNHLSNQLYGVPGEAVARFDAIDPEELGKKPTLRVRKEGWDGAWDLVEFDDLEVVSPYSAQGGRDYEDRGALVAWLWRWSFGTSSAQAGAESFPAAHLRMKAYLSWKPGVDARGVPVYHTLVFGAVINKAYDAVDPAENERFLALQMRSIEALLAAERGAGFGEVPALQPAQG